LPRRVSHDHQTQALTHAYWIFLLFIQSISPKADSVLLPCFPTPEHTTHYGQESY
jgi:hypothetical protein